MGKATTWIDVLVKIERDKAVLVNNGDRDAWVPRSLVLDSEDDLGAGVETKIEIPEWLAEEKELI